MPNRKQTEIAHGCSMTVVADPDSFIHNGETIPGALARTYPDGSPPETRRYDLLAVPGLKYLPKNRAAADLVVEDVLTAVGLHGAEDLLVVTADHCHTPVVRCLTEHPRLKKVMRNIRGFTASSARKPNPMRTLVLTCMDWRMHGPGGFAETMRRTFGLRDGFAQMTVPGAAKELMDGGRMTLRGEVVAGQIAPLIRRGLSRVIVVSHTDCGKYGGSGAFAGWGDQLCRLARDLDAAAAFFGGLLGVPKYDGRIAVVQGHAVACLEEPGRCAVGTSGI